ncbi:MAG: NADH-dependent flavin oxidoreductase [Vibrio sp.]
MKAYQQEFKFENGQTLKNAVVMAPMTTWSGDDEGYLTQAELDYYRARSTGVGMVITATTYTVPSGKGFAGQFYAGSPSHHAQLKELADAIQHNGAKAVLQIFHAGRASNKALLGGEDVVSASDIPALRPDSEKPRPLTQTEIDDIITSFATTTQAAIDAGFDGVEIHGANTYLIQQFFSPHSNRRDDIWGGDLRARMAFPLAIIDVVQQTVQQAIDEGKATPDFLVGYRFSPEELENPGITLDDTLTFIDVLADKPLDYLHVSLRHYAQTVQRDAQDERITLKALAEKIDGRLPLIGVGTVVTEADVEAAQALGADLVAVGKPLIYDHKWYEKTVAQEAVVDGLNQTFNPDAIIPKPLHEMLHAIKDFMGVKVID